MKNICYRVNKIETILVSAHMVPMKVLNLLITALVAGLISSCAQNKYQDVQSSEIKHSSPDVLSLYEYENEKLRRENESGGFINMLLDGLIGSDPDDDYHSSHHHHERRSSSSDKKEFISNNGGSLRESLKDKKR